MNEDEFIKRLQNRAREQEEVIHKSPFPKIFMFVSIWLGKHPWRIIIPLSILITIILRFIFGVNYTNFILAIFKNI